jgi:hypothetical protein
VSTTTDESTDDAGRMLANLRGQVERVTTEWAFARGVPVWHDYPALDTPITAEALTLVERGIAGLVADLRAVLARDDCGGGTPS